MNGKRVMVVDDLAENLLTTVEELNTLGFHASGFSSGEEAIANLKAQPQSFDFAVIDEFLGTGMDGIETAEQLINTNANLFCVIFTNIPSSDPIQIEEVRSRALDAGAYRYMERSGNESKQIEDFVAEIEQLAELRTWISSYYESRLTAPSLPRQLAVSVHVVDRHHKIWFIDEHMRHLLNQPQKILPRLNKAPWHTPNFGCKVELAITGRCEQHRLCVVRLPGPAHGDLSYLRIWSQPVCDSSGRILVNRSDGNALAVMECVHEIHNLNEIPPAERIQLIANSLRDIPAKDPRHRLFERVRIYIHKDSTFLLSAAPGEDYLHLDSPRQMDSYFADAVGHMKAQQCGYFFPIPGGRDPLSLQHSRESFIYWPVLNQANDCIALIEAIGPHCNPEVVQVLKPYAAELEKALCDETNPRIKSAGLVEAELAAVDNKLQGIHSRHAKLQILIRSAIELTSSDLAGIRYRENDAAKVYKIGLAQNSIYETVAVPMYSLDNGKSWSVKTITSGQEQFIDINRDFTAVTEARSELSPRAKSVLQDMNSMAFLPLITAEGHRCIGALALHSRTIDNYKDERVKAIARGIARRLASILHDILVAKTIREEIQQRQKERFSAIIHNLRRPLYHITVAIEILQSAIHSPERKNICLAKLDEIERYAGHIDDLGRILEKFQSESESKRARCRLHGEIQRWAEAIVPDGSGIYISFELEPELDSLEIDIEPLKVCFEILLYNAIEELMKPIPEKRIRVKLRHIDQKEARLSKSAERMCAIDVIDSGTGVPEEMHGSLFSPVTSSKPEGKGWGLTLCKILVESLDGVAYFNEDAAQTTFTLIFPFVQYKVTIQ